MAGISAPRDNNRVPVLIGTSSSDGITPVTVYVDPTTHRLKVDSAGGSSGITIGTTTITSGTSTRILYDNAGVVGEYTISGSGTVVAMATSPVFTTPTLGVASATSINKVAITAPATGSTLTIADGKTFTANDTVTVGTSGIVLGNSGGLTVVASKVLTVNKSLTLDGTDSTTMTFPSTSATIARTDAGQTFTGVNTFTSPSITTSIVTGSSSFDAFNTTATTLNIGGAATTFALGGTPTGAVTANIFTNATAAATTKTLNIGTGGAASSTTNINIGSANGGTTTINSTAISLGGTSGTTTTGTIELGNASDTTLSRVSAGVVAVEGVRVITSSGTTSGTILKNNGTTFVASTETYASPGTSGNVMTSDGTNWTSAAPSGGGGFISQELQLAAGTMTPISFATCSSSDGLTLFLAWIDSSVNTTLNITRWTRTTSTAYRQTHSTTLTVSATELYGITILGNYVYVQCAIAGTGAFRRYDKADLANVTTMTISGTNNLRSGWSTWSDGTNLYVYHSSGNYTQWTISGTTATNNGQVGFTTAGVSSGVWSDGTNVWITDNSTATGTMTIRKYPVAGGSATATQTTTILGTTRPNAQNATPVVTLFSPGSNILAYCVMYNVCSDTAKTGIEILATGIEMP